MEKNLGANFKLEDRKGSGDDTAGNNIRLYTANGHVSEAGPMMKGKWQGRKYCRQGLRICGFKTRVERKQGTRDDTALNGVRFYCR